MEFAESVYCIVVSLSCSDLELECIAPILEFILVRQRCCGYIRRKPSFILSLMLVNLHRVHLFLDGVVLSLTRANDEGVSFNKDCCNIHEFRIYTRQT